MMQSRSQVPWSRIATTCQLGLHLTPLQPLHHQQQLHRRQRLLHLHPRPTKHQTISAAKGCVNMQGYADADASMAWQAKAAAIQ
jgi:hypothetical protein